MRQLLEEWSATRPPVIGMLHLAPLPGAPRHDGDMDAVRERLLADAAALVDGGVDGLMLENFGDAPFHPDGVPAHVVAHMTALALEVRRRFELPLGINCLRNDALASLAVAHAVGARFIRVNVLCGARITDQGLIQGRAHELMRERHRLQAGHIRVVADVDVKHSAPLGQPRPLTEEVHDLVERGLADAVVVSGSGTGRQADSEHLAAVREAAGRVPVLVGSGVTSANVLHYLELADGLIVGTAFKWNERASEPVEPLRVRAIMERVSRWREAAD